MTPRPPSCAIAMARPDSVTVSMAALRIGTLSRMFRVSRVETSTCDGFTFECCGTSSTSSKVSAVVMVVSVRSRVETGAVRSIGSSNTQKADASSAFHSSRGLPVALLVFLSAPTWARIVAADFRFLPPHRLDHIVSAGPRWRWRLRLRCRLARSAAGKWRHWWRAGVVHHHPRWCRTARCGPWRAPCDRRLGLAFLHRHGTEPEQVADDLLLDARFHVLVRH